MILKIKIIGNEVIHSNWDKNKSLEPELKKALKSHLRELIKMI